MKAQATAFDLDELCRNAGVTSRTVRYYIQRGLLPSPGSGRGTRYGVEYLNRLRFIRQLQKRHLPLDDIGAQLKAMSDAEIAEAVGSHEAASSAADYIAATLADLGAANSEPVASVSREPETTVAPDGPSTWQRIPVAPGLELHAQRPASRERSRQIEKILAAARRILAE